MFLCFNLFLFFGRTISQSSQTSVSESPWTDRFATSVRAQPRRVALDDAGAHQSAGRGRLQARGRRREPDRASLRTRLAKRRALCLCLCLGTKRVRLPEKPHSSAYVFPPKARALSQAAKPTSALRRHREGGTTLRPRTGFSTLQAPHENFPLWAKAAVTPASRERKAHLAAAAGHGAHVCQTYLCKRGYFSSCFHAERKTLDCNQTDLKR